MAESQKTFAFKTKSFNEKNILPNTGISDSKVKHPFQKILSKTFELGQIINNISNNPAKIHPASIRDFLHNISNIRTIFKNYIRTVPLNTTAMVFQSKTDILLTKNPINVSETPIFKKILVFPVNSGLHLKKNAPIIHQMPMIEEFSSKARSTIVTEQGSENMAIAHDSQAMNSQETNSQTTNSQKNQSSQKQSSQNQSLQDQISQCQNPHEQSSQMLRFQKQSSQNQSYQEHGSQNQSSQNQNSQHQNYQNTSSQTMNSQRMNSQTTNSQTTNPQNMNSQTMSSQSTNSQTTDSQNTNSQTKNSQIMNFQTMNSQATNSQITNPEIMNSQNEKFSHADKPFKEKPRGELTEKPSFEKHFNEKPFAEKQCEEQKIHIDKLNSVSEKFKNEERPQIGGYNLMKQNSLWPCGFCEYCFASTDQLAQHLGRDHLKLCKEDQVKRLILILQEEFLRSPNAFFSNPKAKVRIALARIENERDGDNRTVERIQRAGDIVTPKKMTRKEKYQKKKEENVAKQRVFEKT